MEQTSTTNMDVEKDTATGNVIVFDTDVNIVNENGNDVANDIIPNEHNGSANEDVDNVDNDEDDDDDYVIDLTDLFPNSEDNPIEYIYHRDSTGRVIAVDCLPKQFNAPLSNGNTTGTASNNTVLNVSTMNSLPPFERILTPEEFAKFCMTFHQR